MAAHLHLIKGHNLGPNSVAEKMDTRGHVVNYLGGGF